MKQIRKTNGRVTERGSRVGECLCPLHRCWGPPLATINPQISLPPSPYTTRKTTMASRITRSIPRALRAHAAPLSTSAPAPASASAKLVARNALLTTAAPKVPRSASRFLVGDGQKRAASSDEGVTMMVRRVCFSRESLSGAVRAKVTGRAGCTVLTGFR